MLPTSSPRDPQQASGFGDGGPPGPLCGGVRAGMRAGPTVGECRGAAAPLEGPGGGQLAGSAVSGNASGSSRDRDAMNSIDISETPAYVPARKASATHHAETIIPFPPLPPME